MALSSEILAFTLAFRTETSGCISPRQAHAATE